MLDVRQQQNDSISSKFLFIPVDGLQTRKCDNAKPESQKYLTAARKHVMYEIGLSRRRVKKKKARDPHDELALRLQARGRVPKPVQEPQRGQDDGLIIQNIPVSVSEEESHYEASAFPALHTNPINQVRKIVDDELFQLQQPAICGTRLDPFVRWPVSITYRMQYLLDHLLFTDCKSIRPFRSVTWPLLNLDHGIFYHGLAISAFCLSTRYPPTKRHALVSEGLFYYSKGLNSVNKSLGDKLQRQSDGVIASILGIAIHALTGPASNGWCWETAQPSLQKSEDDTDQWIIHFRALKTIFDHRGGLEQFGVNHIVRHWLYIMDVEGTATRDIPPFFPLPTYIQPVRQITQSSRRAPIAACLSSWAQEFPALSKIIGIFADLDCTISCISDQLAIQNNTFWTRLDLDVCWLVPLLHRCLQLSRGNKCGLTCKNEFSPSGPCDEMFQDALRHAIILFLAPIRRCFGPPASGSQIHVAKLESALSLCFMHPAAPKLEKLTFWMLVTGGLETCSLGQDASWFLSRIVDQCADIGVKQFEDVRLTVKHAMSQLIWLEEAMASGFELMMENLRTFMESPGTTEQ